MTSKQRYDLKRRGDANRKQKEAERALTRWMTRRGLLVKTGWCHSMDCQASIDHSPTKTVWHHLRYQLAKPDVIELCYKCHRKAHPRPMPNGKLI